MVDLELYHSGVLGMKWGVRNSETMARYARAKRAYKSNQNSKTKNRYKQAKQEYKLEKKKIKYAQNWTKAYKHRNLYTTEELNSLIDRFNKEKKLKELSNFEQDNSSIDSKINKAINTGTKLVDLYNKSQPKDFDYNISLRKMTPKKLDKMSIDELKYVANKVTQINVAQGGKKDKPVPVIDMVNKSYDKQSVLRLTKQLLKDEKQKDKKISKNKKEKSF